MNFPPGISVVIPNYNGEKLLAEILPPLFIALQNQQLPYEVIVSDDASTDQSVRILENIFPGIKLLKSVENKGFGPTANKGIFSAGFSLTLLLNSDVKLEPDYFLHITKYFDEEDTFGVMGRIIGWDDDIIQDGGKYPSFHGVKLKTSKNFVAGEPSFSDKLYTMYLSGANALMSTEKFRLIGGFNELFAPFYVEDTELSLRAWRLGYKCYYDHFSLCRHKLSETIKNSKKKDYIKTIYYRNKMFLHAIHLPNEKLKVWNTQTRMEALLYIGTFRMFYVKALKLFKDNFALITASRRQMEELSLKTGKLLSLDKVIEMIHQSLEQKNIKIF